MAESRFLGLESGQATEIARLLDAIADRMTRVSADAAHRLGGVDWYGPDQRAVEADVHAFAAEMRRAAERMTARAAVVRAAVHRQEEASR